MPSDHAIFRRLLLRSALALAIGAGVTALCIAFVDRLVALAVNHFDVPEFEPFGVPVFRWATLPPPFVQAWAPALLVLLAVRRALGPFRPGELAVFTACVAVIIADQFAESLRFVFGRLWPETWIDANPALIPGGRYGFYPFRGGEAYADFPSGHMARTVAAVAIVWVAWPRWRWLAAALASVIAIGLVAMDYHFVGDVVAGSVVGGIVGAFAAGFAGMLSGGRRRR